MAAEMLFWFISVSFASEAIFVSNMGWIIPTEGSEVSISEQRPSSMCQEKKKKKNPRTTKNIEMNGSIL